MLRSERLRRILGRVVVAGLLAGAGYYAVFGGEYSWFDLRRIRAEADSLRTQLDSLRAVADSLERRSRALEHDRLLLERVAREEHGMIRDGEILYRFLPYDSLVSPSSSNVSQ